MEMIYIRRRKANVVQWVEPRPLFEVCSGGERVQGVGHRRDAWCRQEAMEKQFQESLAGILWEVKRRRSEEENDTK